MGTVRSGAVRALERDGTGDETMVRIQQYEEPAQLPEAMMMSEPGLPLSAMSGSMVLPLPGSVLRSKTHAITKTMAWAAT